MVVVWHFSIYIYLLPGNEKPGPGPAVVDAAGADVFPSKTE